MGEEWLHDGEKIHNSISHLQLLDASNRINFHFFFAVMILQMLVIFVSFEMVNLEYQSDRVFKNSIMNLVTF